MEKLSNDLLVGLFLSVLHKFLCAMVIELESIVTLLFIL